MPDGMTHKLRWTLYHHATSLAVALQSSVSVRCRPPRQPKWFLAWSKALSQLRWAVSLENYRSHSCGTT